MIITISRGTLSGGERLAQQLAEKLGYKVISREVIVEAALEYGVSEEQLLEEMEKPPGLLERITHHKDRYMVAMRAALGELIEGDGVIYHGHAGQFMLQGLSSVISLRLIAPLEYRVRAAMAERKLSRDAARKYVEAVDEQRTRWVRKMYDAEWADPSLYDLVINLEQMSIETATNVIAAMAEKKTLERAPENARELHDFALKSRIVAQLIFRSSFPADIVEISVRDGRVSMKGGDAFEREREEVIRFVKAIEGVESVTPDSHAHAEEETAAEVMLPISGYPRVPQELSIREAINALAGSSIQLKDGHEILPRYVLVEDEQQRLVGVVSRRDLLKGLSVQLRSFEQAQKDLRSVTAAPDLSYSISFRWISFFNQSAVDCAREPVGSIMAPIAGTVRPDQSLSVVVTTMIQAGIDLVPVMDKERAVGVILMTDVFDRVAQFILESPPSAEEPEAEE